MQIDILLKTKSRLIEQKKIKTLAKETIKKVLKDLKIDDCEVSIAFVNKEEIRALNKKYRNKNRVTDTLSFPMQEGEYLEINPTKTLGDIVICLEKAIEQAQSVKHSVEGQVYCCPRQWRSPADAGRPGIVEVRRVLQHGDIDGPRQRYNRDQSDPWLQESKAGGCAAGWRRSHLGVADPWGGRHPGVGVYQQRIVLHQRLP